MTFLCGLTVDKSFWKRKTAQKNDFKRYFCKIVNEKI